MRPEEKQENCARYAERLRRFGHDPRSLGWDKRQHRLRYAALLDHWPAAKISVLDVGCGFGDLASFCAATGRDVAYTGIDLSPELIETGRRAAPDRDLRVWDWDLAGAPGRFDIVVASGLFHHRLADSDSFIHRMLLRFRAAATMGLAVNFMSTTAERRYPHLHYADPAAMLAEGLAFSRRVLLRHDYMPFEFTLIVDLRQDFRAETSAFLGSEALVDPPPPED
ncbi:bifunctional 2-polyprenyl-6-hydroxyphenol methylase/3-demethylubiquinol 3-O-methyltransferase UbiG [Roseomonas sp. 18066]|uniref:class I SAM-dependent methyltransferase n=1 Tax=Roseomonas sp. 18066 TaxID=2681412 RepID=UPI00135CA462|nr:class I SAM-dependent methyltransferase [Roseomonas sp. 18066]